MNKIYSDAIKRNIHFQNQDIVDIMYQFHCPEYSLLEEKYHIKQIAGKSDLDKALKLLIWVNKHIHHTGNYDNSDEQDALTLLEVAYDKEYGINCLSMSIVLCECLLAVNIKARVMYMMPQEVNDGDNHVVVEAFISELNKWIMLDPTYGSYTINSKGYILNLYELRKCIEQDKNYLFSETINYNGTEVEDIDDVKDYYAKNLFFLRCKKYQGYGQHRQYGNIIEVAPCDFDVHERMIENLKYRINEYGNFPIFLTWKEYEENLNNVYVDIETIY